MRFPPQSAEGVRGDGLAGAATVCVSPSCPGTLEDSSRRQSSSPATDRFLDAAVAPRDETGWKRSGNVALSFCVSRPPGVANCRTRIIEGDDPNASRGQHTCVRRADPTGGTCSPVVRRPRDGHKTSVMARVLAKRVLKHRHDDRSL